MTDNNRDVYDILLNKSFHETASKLGTRYSVMGGIALSAVTHADSVDWDGRTIVISSEVSLPQYRENGTRRDLDVLFHSTDKDIMDGSYQQVRKAIDGELTVSAFRLWDYNENKPGYFDFLGRQYVDQSGRTFWRTSGIETELPASSLETWNVIREDRVVCEVLNPVAQLGAYMNRSIGGEKLKDKDKIVELRNIIMPSGKIKDIPAAYREQYIAFMEQSQKIRKAACGIGLVALKAGLVRCIEQYSWATSLIQNYEEFKTSYL